MSDLRKCDHCMEMTSFSGEEKYLGGNACGICDDWICDNCVDWKNSGYEEDIICKKCSSN